MLAVEKEKLMVETARDVAVLREAELKYYIEHISGVQTMATLLAGFAFSAIISMDTPWIDLSSILLLQSSGDYLYNETTGEIVQSPPVWPDPLQVVAFGASVMPASQRDVHAVASARREHARNMTDMTRLQALLARGTLTDEEEAILKLHHSAAARSH